MNETDNIKLKMDVLNGKSNSYVSMTDLYDVNIFTDKNMLEFQNKKTKESEYFSDIGTNVFLDKWEDTESTFQANLFLEKMSISKKQEITGETKIMNIGISFIVVFVFIIFVLCMIRYNIYRMIRRRKDADNGNFYQ